MATGLYSGYFVVASILIGLSWWRRRPHSRFGPLLMAFGALAWVYSGQSSSAPLLFDLGVLVEGPLAWLTFYLLLAFPSGRLRTTIDRVLVWALGVALILCFGLWALLSPAIAGAGPLAACTASCPDNVLQVASAPGLAGVAGDAEVYLGLVLTLAVVLVYARRLSVASRPQRRSLIAVAATSLLFLPVFFVFHFSHLVLHVEPARLDALAWALVGCRVLLPLGFLAALWQAELFAGRALRRLIDELAARPTVEQWRARVGAALDDPQLRIGHWVHASGRYVGAGGAIVEAPAVGSGRAWVQAELDGVPVAAMDVDEALTEDPELVAAAASATRLATENGDLETELLNYRIRAAEAGEAERRRIQRDLHDSAQQRLVALRIHLGLAGEKLAGTEGGALIARLGLEVDEAIAEIRTIAQGAPDALTARGLGPALRAASEWTAIPVRIVDEGVRRHAPAVEAAVYFCCLEALQNAAKHGGPGVRATVVLAEAAHELRFVVQDDGRGFEPAVARRGDGLSNICDRVEAVGGTTRIDSGPGRGTRISGRVPI